MAEAQFSDVPAEGMMQGSDARGRESLNRSDVAWLYFLVSIVILVSTCLLAWSVFAWIFKAVEPSAVGFFSGDVALIPMVAGSLVLACGYFIFRKSGAGRAVRSFRFLLAVCVAEIVACGVVGWKVSTHSFGDPEALPVLIGIPLAHVIASACLVAVTFVVVKDIRGRKSPDQRNQSR